MKLPCALSIMPLLLVAACAIQPPPRPAAGMAPEPVAASACLRQTGTRLTPPEGRCVAASGRVLHAEDLERAGVADTGDALRRLVPF